jgi:hypothetical protein
MASGDVVEGKQSAERDSQEQDGPPAQEHERGDNTSEHGREDYEARQNLQSPDRVEERPEQHVWAEHASNREQNVEQKFVSSILVTTGARRRNCAPFAELHSGLC